MNEREISDSISTGGYVFNINLPDWKSQKKDPAQEAAEINAKKKRIQNIVAFVILGVLVFGIIYSRKNK
ncbi:hypothetical protein [Brumimicrobium mesophilum]|uniref:hypothetical protein n=1 Tax=Brumimicrobium mesophilum TaxID=392717 RepID=UPI000D140B9E|nr:hypothetical protein [Brumimicrobium mesophilum]